MLPELNRYLGYMKGRNKHLQVWSAECDSSYVNITCSRRAVIVSASDHERRLTRGRGTTGGDRLLYGTAGNDDLSDLYVVS